jgi:ClpP class serine protease
MALQKAIESRHEGLKWPGSSSWSSSRHVGSLGFGHDLPSVASPTAVASPSSHPTVVILDWSKNLDLDRVADQVSFLLSEHRSLATTSRYGGSPSNSTTTTATTATTATISSTATTTPPTPSSSDTDGDLEVVLLLNSEGGSAPDFGAAARHLMRLRNAPGVTLTVCVDRVAASGGYMLCCTASPGQLFAAPFAVLGSIGVLGQVINVQDLLEGWGIRPLIFRAGKDKVPVGALGEITEEGKRTTQSFVDATHRAFRDYVTAARPVLIREMDKIGNGNVFLGADALDVKLIDGISTSDEYISSKLQAGARVLKMIQNPRTNFLFGPRYGDTAHSETRGSTILLGFAACLHTLLSRPCVGKFSRDSEAMECLLRFGSFFQM